MQIQKQLNKEFDGKLKIQTLQLLLMNPVFVLTVLEENQRTRLKFFK